MLEFEGTAEVHVQPQQEVVSNLVIVENDVRLQQCVGACNSVLLEDWRQGSRLRYKQVIVVGLTVKQLFAAQMTVIAVFVCLFEQVHTYVDTHNYSHFSWFE